MLKPRLLLLIFLSLTLLASPACQRKGLKCPKPSKSKTISTPGGVNMEGIKVHKDRNGLVKKKKFLGVF